MITPSVNLCGKPIQILINLDRISTPLGLGCAML